MGRGLMPVLPRERPACPPGEGGHHPSTPGEGAAAPEVPEHEAKVAQGEKEVGAEEGIEPSPESMEE